MPRKRGEGCVSCRFLDLFELNQIVGHLAGGLIFISESARGRRPLTFVVAGSETLANFGLYNQVRTGRQEASHETSSQI